MGVVQGRPTENLMIETSKHIIEWKIDEQQKLLSGEFFLSGVGLS